MGHHVLLKHCTLYVWVNLLPRLLLVLFCSALASDLVALNFTCFCNRIDLTLLPSSKFQMESVPDLLCRETACGSARCTLGKIAE